MAETTEFTPAYLVCLEGDGSKLRVVVMGFDSLKVVNGTVQPGGAFRFVAAKSVDMSYNGLAGTGLPEIVSRRTVVKGEPETLRGWFFGVLFNLTSPLGLAEHFWLNQQADQLAQVVKAAANNRATAQTN